MTSVEDVPRIIHPANVISASATKIQEALSAENVPSLSFDEIASNAVPSRVSAEQDSLLDATAELHDLLLELLNLIHRHCGVSPRRALA